MKLFKQDSERLNNKGEAYIDLYLAWTYENKTYLVRVFPSFHKDYKLLASTAFRVPKGEAIEKYL